MHSLNLDFSNSDIDIVRKNINGFKEVINRFQYVRNKLVSHNDKKIVDVVDIRRNLMNNRSIHSKELFEKSSKEFLKNVSEFLLQIEDFLTIKKHTINIVLDLKKLLKMPDRIFGKSGNLEEWENFYKLRKNESVRFFELILMSPQELPALSGAGMNCGTEHCNM